jgi:WD40 repeat protein
VLTAGADGMVRRWTRDLEPFCKPLDAHPGGTWAIDLSPTGEVMVTGGQDGVVRLWRAGTWRSWLGTAEARSRVGRANAA